MAEEAKGIAKVWNGVKGKVKGPAKWAAIGGIAIGTLAVLPAVISRVRSGRKEDSDAAPAMPAELAAAVPEVLTPEQMGMGPQAMNQQTMMGMPPVEGGFAQQVKAQRGGEMTVDPNAPSIVRADGTNSVDGRFCLWLVS